MWDFAKSLKGSHGGEEASLRTLATLRHEALGGRGACVVAAALGAQLPEEATIEEQALCAATSRQSNIEEQAFCSHLEAKVE